MRIELRLLHSPDLPGIEKGDIPDDPEHFLILVQAFVAEVGPGTPVIGEDFAFLVCTPAWIAAEVREAGYVLGRTYIILPRYDYGRLRRIIAALCEQAEGADWDEVATKLGRFGQWEWDPTLTPKIDLASY